MYQLTSPDGHIVLDFLIMDDGQDRDIFRSCPAWRVRAGDAPVLLESRLGLYPDGEPTLLTHFRVENTESRTHDSTWYPVCGERSVVRDHWNELTVTLRESLEPKRVLQLIFRAYDTGVAMRYTIPAQPGMSTLAIWQEGTRFHLPPGCEGWDAKRAQGQYVRKPIQQIGDDCERPLLVWYPGDRWAAIGEADQYDYPRMKLCTDRTRPDTLAAQLSGGARRTLPFSTPWRYVIVGNRAADIPERNDLPLNLCPPNRINDPSWIRPGKAIREVTLSTSGARACVDFAMAHNLQYVLFDGGWYGHPLDEATDATTVGPWEQKIRNQPDHKGLDIQAAIEYAHSRGVGVWLYVDQHGLERQLQRLVTTYASWGVAGIKFGFVHVGPQGWSRWVMDAVQLCAEHRLMVDIHDEYRPTGLQRTWPNLVNVEGIGGNETFPEADHNVTLPFTRFVAGMADYTICIYSPRLRTRRTQQLAMAVCYFAPFELLYWYDLPEQFQGEPELAFLDAVPTVWDDTRILDGAPGQFVITARRAGQEWFIGAMNGLLARDVTIRLDFLECASMGILYHDGGQGQNDVAIEQLDVDSSSVLKVSMEASGGAAVHLVPAHTSQHNRKADS